MYRVYIYLCEDTNVLYKYVPESCGRGKGLCAYYKKGLGSIPRKDLAVSHVIHPTADHLVLLSLHTKLFFLPISIPSNSGRIE